MRLSVGDEIDRDGFLLEMTRLQYRRNPTSPERGEFRVKGETIE
ncbi:MAG: hypothetical protein AB1630_12235 [bacterium]